MLSCDRRVSAIIMNLLSLAQDKAVPAADDFVPVLVYVSSLCHTIFWSYLLVLLHCTFLHSQLWLAWSSLSSLVKWHLMLQGDNQSQPTFTSLYRAVCGQLLQVSTHHTIPANVFPLSSEEFHWFWLYLYFRDRLCGEECYWWMQFVGAVEFIKTMEWINTECGERGDI